MSEELLVFQCPRCGIPVRTKKRQMSCCGDTFKYPVGFVQSSPSTYKPKPERNVIKHPCKHQGEFVKTETCPSCSGHVEIKLFSCNKFGLCSLEMPIGRACCKLCGSYEKKPQPGPLDISDVTIVVTSFIRFDCLKRFLISVRYYYPSVKIIVADQSGELAKGDDYEFCLRFPNVMWLALPYDCGLSTARNTAIKYVDTPFTFICDDDEVFSDESRLEALYDVLANDTSVKLVCGLIRRVGHLLHGQKAGSWSADLYQNDTTLYAEAPRAKWEQTEGGTWYRKIDRYINVFMSRTELLVQYPWNERHKISGEHLDHVLLLKSNKVGCAYTPQFIVGEIKSEDNPAYSALRVRGRESDAHNDWNITDKTGDWLFRPEPAIKVIKSKVPSQSLPCVVILTAGNTGSTVTAGLLSLLGWKLPDNDPEYNEPTIIRDANIAIMSGRHPDCNKLLASLPTPWVVKDPRFCYTLESWLPAMIRYKPLLIRLDRNYSNIVRSWIRRGEPIADLKQRLINVERIYEFWPWAKTTVCFDHLIDWAAALDPDRARQINHVVSSGGAPE